MFLHYLLGVALVAAVAYAMYKHLTVSDIKAELAKIESEIASGALATEVKSLFATAVARLKALL